jgi:hypothetical protein
MTAADGSRKRRLPPRTAGHRRAPLGEAFRVPPKYSEIERRRK